MATIRGFTCMQATRSVAIQEGRQGHEVAREAHPQCPPFGRISRQRTERHPGRIGIGRLLPRAPDLTLSKAIIKEELQASIAQGSGGKGPSCHIVGSRQLTQRVEISPTSEHN